MEKTWNKNEIKRNLQKDDLWVIRGVLAIYNRQTSEEQQIQDTKEHNGVGFNGVDGHIMSSFAEQIRQWESNPSPQKYRTPLSVKQLQIARKKIIKYSGQLTKIANGEI